MQTNAILTATSTAGKKISTTITYLRPEQKSHASELAIALNNLTTNTYVSTQVNEMNVDISETQKLTASISLGEWSSTSSSGFRTAEIIYNGDGTLATTSGMIISGTNTLQASTGNSGIVYAQETENYSAAVLQFTVPS